jgi:transcription antitermination factor NusG
MSNDHDEEIKNIVAQLKGLQIQESELLQRLEQLSETNNRNTPTPLPASPTQIREFRIGDLVKILNPKPFQIKKGTIIRIGVDTDRITVQSTNGSSKVIRASFNLAHLD